MFTTSAQALSSVSADIQIRPITCQDQETVWEMLRHAAHETDLEVEQVKENPLLRPYAAEFGTHEGDVGVMAECGDAIVGAAWVRTIRGFATSHLNDETLCPGLFAMPELAIACLPEVCGRGIGTQLLQALLAESRGKGFSGICLSCRDDNLPALRLYERMGFLRVPGAEITNRAGGSSLTMRYRFEDSETDN